MDFALSEEHRALQQEAREFAANELRKELALECELSRRYPRELQRKAGERGLIAVHLPREHGGRGLGLLGSVLVIEALASADPGLGMAISLSSLGSQLVNRFGTAEQRRRILPRATAGEILTAIALTEPDHGSDLTDLATTAVREGDELVIRGVKTMISNGQNAHVVTVLCKTEPSADPAYRGQTLVLVESDRPGFQTRDLGVKMGLRMMSTAEITLDGVRVPAANVVGEWSRGFYHALAFLNESRVEVAAQALGGAQAAFDRALRHVKGRRQFGKRLADLQITQHKLADMATKIEAARMLTYRAAWVADNRAPDAKLSAMAKLYAGRVAVEVAEEAIQMLGGYGYFLEHDVERIYRDVRVTEIYEGTREIQKHCIAGYLLD